MYIAQCNKIINPGELGLKLKCHRFHHKPNISLRECKYYCNYLYKAVHFFKFLTFH